MIASRFRLSASVLLGCAALLLGQVPPVAHAQNGPPPQQTGWQLDVGAGALISPQYLGDDSYAVSALPYIRVTKGERFFASVQEGLGYTLFNQNGFRAGPLLQVAFGRDEDGRGPFQITGDRTDDLLGLGDIDTSVLLGGFAEYSMGLFSLSGKIGQAVSGHDGLVADIGLRYKGVLSGYGPPLIYSFGPSVEWGDDRYTQAFFGVSQEQSAASGLARYDARGGVVRYGISATGIVPLSRTLSATLLLSYGRLAGDSAKAPLVQTRGDTDQAVAGLFLARRF